jgi:hypothetical protein
MLFLVLAEARDTLVGEAVPKLRADVATAMERIGKSGKMQAGGIMGGRRMAFCLLEVATAAELLELLGTEIIDNMQVETHPIISFEELGAFFAQHPWK